MGRLLDVLAIVLLVLAAVALVAGVYVMSTRDDVAALLSVACGFVLLRSSVDLLRPRSAG
jgi:hypothetical protein